MDWRSAASSLVGTLAPTLPQHIDPRNSPDFWQKMVRAVLDIEGPPVSKMFSWLVFSIR